MSEHEKIWVITEVEPTQASEHQAPITRGIGELGDPQRFVTQSVFKRIGIQKSVLANNLKAFVQDIQGVLGGLEPQEGDYQLDEVALTLSINASGGIELVGKMEAGVTTGISVVLRRK